jgi:uncharacterized membrane protein
MQVAKHLNKPAVKYGLIMGILAAFIMAATDPALAAVPDPTPSKDQYTGMLENLYTLAKLTLKYVGFVVAFAGAILWFSAKRSSQRASLGVWLLIGGVAMIVFNFGFNNFMALIRWVAEGGAV